jgi:hypothetical protein
MKKLITLILASTFILSCSSNSDNNNSTSTGPLIKTETSISGIETLTTNYNYNGNKLSTILFSLGGTANYTYNGDLIIKVENNAGGQNSVYNYNYSNNFLSSFSGNESFPTFLQSLNGTYSYNSNSSITGMTTRTITSSGNTQISNSKHIRYHSQGNCIKDEEFSISNGIATLTNYTTYSYDTNNSPYKNITGFYACYNPRGILNINNITSEIHKNAAGIITSTYQTTYQYNSQNFPISSSTVFTNYTINPQTGVSTQGTPSTENVTITYY